MNLIDKKGNQLLEVTDNSYDKRVERLALHLRDEDFDEVYALTGESPHLTVMESWDTSLRRWLIINKDGLVVAAVGVRPWKPFSDIGIPWLMGTDDLNKLKIFFLKASRYLIREMKKHFTFLVNNVDARYIKTIKWLDWCGCVIEVSRPLGPLGLPFHRVYMECA